MRRQAQSWSMDVVLAVVIFGFITVTLTSFALLERPDVQSLQRDAQQIGSSLANPLAFCSSEPMLRAGSLDGSVTQCLFNTSYDVLRTDLLAREDFCMFLEDEDGRLVPVRLDNGTRVYTVGSEEVQIDGRNCGSW